MYLVIASNNQHKITEIKHIFQDLPINVVSYTELFPDFVEVEEDGKTFQENAEKKVRAFTPQKNCIFLADDSGLEIIALDGKPGIFSARYAGENATKEQLCQKILADLQNIEYRVAQFNSTIALLFPNNKLEIVQGIVKGDITYEMRGKNGFGYDAIFVPEGYYQTFAEMDAKEKNALSHRYLALQKAKHCIAFFLQIK